MNLPRVISVRDFGDSDRNVLFFFFLILAQSVLNLALSDFSRILLNSLNMYTKGCCEIMNAFHFSS